MRYVWVIVCTAVTAHSSEYKYRNLIRTESLSYILLSFFLNNWQACITDLCGLCLCVASVFPLYKITALLQLVCCRETCVVCLWIHIWPFVPTSVPVKLATHSLSQAFYLFYSLILHTHTAQWVTIYSSVSRNDKQYIYFIFLNIKIVMEQIVCSAVHLFAYGMLLGSSFHASIYVPEYESAMFMELPGEMQHPALTMYDPFL